MECTMTEADSESIQNPNCRQMTIGEIHNLAGRLISHAGSLQATNAPSECVDLRLAAKVIRALVRSFNQSDVVTIENGA